MGSKSPVKLPRLMRDDPGDYPPGPRAQEIAERNRRTVETVLDQALSFIG